MGWTDPRTWSFEEVVTAAQLNEQLRDNMNHLASKVVDVRRYGAVGGDAAADTAAFKNAIPDARADNVPLYVPDLGTSYWINEALPDIDWQAGFVADVGAVLIATAPIAYVLRHSQQYSYMYGIEVDANNNATDAIVFVDSARTLVQRAFARNADNDGFNVDTSNGNCNIMQFDNCYSSDNTRAGYGVEAATDNNGILWSNCDAKGNDVGILGRGIGGRVEYGNYFQNTTSGIKLGDSADAGTAQGWVMFFPWLEQNGTADVDGIHYGNATRTFFMLDPSIQNADLANQGTGRNFGLRAGTNGVHFESGGGRIEFIGSTVRMADGTDLLLSNPRLTDHGQTMPAALDDNTGGATDDILEVVSGSGADTAINNNFAELHRDVQAIREALINLGIPSA